MKNNIVKCNDFNSSNLNFKEPVESDKSKGQRISFPSYEGENKSPPVIRLPEIYIEMYGIPDIDNRYIMNDSQRSFVKLPLNQEDPKIKELSDFLKKLDDKFGSDEYKNKLFGNKAKKYTYNKLFKEPTEDDDDDDNPKKSKVKKLPYMKIKIHTDYESNKVNTGIILVPQDKTDDLTIVQNIHTIDDLNKYICYKCKIEGIVQVLKLWALAPTHKEPTYGVSLRLIKAKIKMPLALNNANNKEFVHSIEGFEDSDEEDVLEKEGDEDKVANDDDDDDDDDEEQNDMEER